MDTMIALEDLKAHVGRRESADDIVTAAPANLLRLAFGRAEPELGPGDPLPPGWQCLYFLPRFTPDALRPDGSPLDTGVIPPMPLPRRMFAGERFRFHRPLRIGEAIRRETELADISVKTGGTGTLVFATVVQRIFAGAALAIEEERRTVFREEVRAGERNQAPRREPAPDDVPWRRRVAPDPVLLFRFSALTFNSHRIHYDRPWAMEREGYPGLVVHGPLTSTLLIDFARDHARGRAFATYETQARAPLFDTAAFELRGRPSADGRALELWAVTPEGTVAMSARAELA
ncbi:MAG TPA: MaoC family dehydratase N-terminal domain-containing protein [Methylomirabilota bacterium]|nr:MaoC family dehydratase N-terminal domain-containing protein [Methylomirabilota bacterium]